MNPVPGEAVGHVFRYGRRTLLGLVAFAFVLRLGVGFARSAFAAEPFRNDEVDYVAIASNMVSGQGYSLNGEIPTAIRSPGYPSALALLFLLIGKNLVAARLANVVISSLTVGAICALGVSLFGRRVGLLAGLATAVYPYWILSGSQLLPEPLFLFLVCVVLLLFQRIAEHPGSWRTHLGCGLAIGLAVLTRPEFLFVVPLIPLWALWFERALRPAFRRSVLLVLPVLLCMGPWLGRNYIVMGGVVLSSSMGQVLWGVHNPETFGDRALMGSWRPPAHYDHPYRLGESPAALLSPNRRYVSELEYNRQQVRRAVDAVRANLRLMPRMIVAKLNRLLLSAGPVENLVRFAMVYCFVFGLVLIVASGDRRFLSLYAVLASGVAAAVIFYAEPRLRMPFDMVLIVVGSYGLIQQVRLVRAVRRSPATDLLGER